MKDLLRLQYLREEGVRGKLGDRKIRARLSILFLIAPLLLATLACQMASQYWGQSQVSQPQQPSAFPSETIPVASPTSTPSATPSPTASATPLPSPTPSQTPTATPRPTSAPLHFEIFEEVWQAVKDDYLYPDFNGVDWDAVYREYRDRIESGMGNDEFYQAMDEMIARLGDEHSIFLSPPSAADEEAQFEGKYDYVGIGVLTVPVFERERVTIILVFPGSPAEESGLKAHDSILSVDGIPILTPDGLPADLLRGPEGTEITLRVQSPGQPERDVKVVRRQITSTLPVPYQVLTRESGKRIGYLLLASFSDKNVDRQVREALISMTLEKPLDGLILDVRPNPGGASIVMSGVISYFTNGTLGHFINRHGREPLQVTGEDISGSQSIPLAVLIGEGTVSFGEIFAGILQDQGRAVLVGEQTSGNVEILWIYEFSDGSRAWIAHDTFRVFNQPDADWEKTGIIPDIYVTSSWDEVTLESDPAIEAALTALADR